MQVLKKSTASHLEHALVGQRQLALFSVGLHVPGEAPTAVKLLATLRTLELLRVHADMLAEVRAFSEPSPAPGPGAHQRP